MEKELHIYFCIFGIETAFLSIDMYHTHKLFDNDTKIIHTTCTHFAHPSYWVGKYRLFIHPVTGDMFEIVIGNKNTNTNKEIREVHNIEKMLISGSFDNNGIIVF